MWRFQTHNIVTGRLVDVVYPASGSWTRRLSGRGAGSHGFKLADSDLSRPQLHDVFADHNVLVVLWDFAPIHGGVIEKPSYALDTDTLTVNHTGIRAMLGARRTFPNGGYATGDLTISGRSAAGAVRAILQRAMDGPGRGLSLDLSHIPDGAGGLDFHWPAHQLPSIDDCLSEVEDRGFEIDFVPQLSGDHDFSWAVTVGKPLVGPMIEHTATAEDSPLSGVIVDRDLVNKATSEFVSGNGTGEDMSWSYAPRDGSFTTPALERYVQSKRDRGDGLAQVADAALAENADGTTQWSFGVNLERESPVSYVPTNTVRVHTRGNKWLDDGFADLRVVSLAGDMSMTLRPEVQHG